MPRPPLLPTTHACGQLSGGAGTRDYGVRVLPRIVSGLVALLLAGASATGCSGQPAPDPSTPSAPAFASDEEAFAAAEETYRAYVDALNEVDLSDPATFEPLFALTTGEANATERKSASEMHAEHLTVSGATVLLGFYPREFSDSSDPRVVAVACTDVSDVDLIDDSGKSIVPADRPDRYALRVTFDASTDTSTGLALASSNRVRESECGW